MANDKKIKWGPTWNGYSAVDEVEGYVQINHVDDNYCYDDCPHFRKDCDIPVCPYWVKKSADDIYED